MVLTNEIIIEKDEGYQKFFEQYDIFYISKGGDYSINLDKYLRKQYKNALSVAYTNNSSVNVLYPKGVMTLEEFKSFVTDENLLVGCAGPYDSYVINVALNSLNNYKNKNITFNNLTGELYFIDSSTIKPNQIKAYRVKIIWPTKNNPDRKPYMTVSATSFTKMERKYYKPNVKAYELLKSKYLTLVDDPNNCNWDFVYSNSNFKDKKNGKTKKTTSSFYDVEAIDRAYIYQFVMEELNKRYEGLFKVSFVQREPENIYPPLKLKSNKFKLVESIKNRTIYLIPNVDIDENKTTIDMLVNQLKIDGFNVKFASRIRKCELNIMINHEPSYYKDGLKDPYPKGRCEPVQCVTIETLNNYVKNGKFDLNSYYVILKELIIKNDLIYLKKISLDNWSKRGISDRITFGTLNNGNLFLLTVNSDGTFITQIESNSIFNNVELEQFKNLLKNDKADFFVKDSYGNINTVTTTEYIVLPDKMILNIKDRNKEYRDKYMEGMYDVRSYSIENDVYYSVGHVNDNKKKQKNATHFYKINIHNTKNILIDLIQTTAVDFVKYRCYTVFPYPVKYLREFVNLIK